MATVILWTANASGYCIRVLAGSQIIDEYRAGNCPHDSQQFMSPGEPGCVGETELRSYALRTAADIASNYRGAVIEEDLDFVCS